MNEVFEDLLINSCLLDKLREFSINSCFLNKW